MFDAAAQHAAWAPLLAFAAGITSSFGPCIAPRFVVVASLTAGTSGWTRWARLGAFIAGLCTSFALLGTIAGALGYIASYSSYVYGALAIALVAGGIGAIVSPHRCRAAHPSSKPIASAPFVVGLTFTAVGSPCCGPIAAALGGLSTAGGNVTFGALLLGAFALGHALPLVVLAAGAVPIVTYLRARALDSAFATVSGALMIALGGYYAVLV